mmetsp:Transcript_60228/g.127578  ORF Transcript_60228/g.127578 Transcript_60228/m.127578 type:complete len:296 (+) Transcript_60228:513-1400(+)
MGLMIGSGERQLLYLQSVQDFLVLLNAALDAGVAAGPCAAAFEGAATDPHAEQAGGAAQRARKALAGDVAVGVAASRARTAAAARPRALESTADRQANWAAARFADFKAAAGRERAALVVAHVAVLCVVRWEIDFVHEEHLGALGVLHSRASHALAASTLDARLDIDRRHQGVVVVHLHGLRRQSRLPIDRALRVAGLAAAGGKTERGVHEVAGAAAGVLALRVHACIMLDSDLVLAVRAFESQVAEGLEVTSLFRFGAAALVAADVVASLTLVPLLHKREVHVVVEVNTIEVDQ